ncbi:MAG TPA: dihydroorotate dehydrogenase-like protein [Thermoguttaceae bacterium]|nr:dihydroorotate dehydrogenase-like protein [Thermoguttaceae bacterium]
MTVDLSTKYLGLGLKNPLIISACPLSEKLDSLKRLEDAGAAAVVLYSLFEEQIEHEDEELAKVHEFGSESFAEALSYFPEPTEYRLGPRSYLEHIEKAKGALSIPVIASLNGTSKGGWASYAQQTQDAGADALELNVYLIAADPDVPGTDVEQQYVDLVAAVKESISIPLAVKVGSQFSSPGNMAKKLAEAGADGLVLFNRFLQPDIDLDELEVRPRVELSTPYELLLPLRWIAILRGRVSASLALTSGIHSAECLAKALLAGADVGMVASTVYQKGFDQVGAIVDGLAKWMEAKGYDSVDKLRGILSQAKCPDPTAFERGNYMKALTSFTGKPV